MSDPFAKDPQLKRWRDACCGAGSDPFPMTKNDAAAVLDRLCAAEDALAEGRPGEEEGLRARVEALATDLGTKRWNVMFRGDEIAKRLRTALSGRADATKGGTP